MEITINIEPGPLTMCFFCIAVIWVFAIVFRRPSVTRLETVTKTAKTEKKTRETTYSGKKGRIAFSRGPDGDITGDTYCRYGSEGDLPPPGFKKV